ncbi:hypothetical protein PG989_001298 [Apiospora arundinis]
MATQSLTPTKVIIIGAGFSGVTMACTLQMRLGLDDYCIYDRNPGVGGAWHVNTYPGCAVDIPGFCYHLSFAPKPIFSRLYPPQKEILGHLTSVAERFGVSTHFTGSVEWTGCQWDDDALEWIVEMENLVSGQRYTQTCQVLVSCVGGLTNPRQVTFPGMSNFQGTIMHTARWDHTVSFSDKRVAVIGNGASAAQVIPALAGTPCLITQIIRASKLGKVGRDVYEKQSLEHVRNSAPRQYWPALIPKYRFGCRRRIFDKAYTAALRRPDIRLAYGKIAEIRSSSIILQDGEEIGADILVLATGFDLSHYDTRVQGMGGKTRDDHWLERGHKSTFKSVGMHGFPNFFFVLGPNSGRLHTSTLLSIEWHSEYISRVIKPIIDGEADVVQVKIESEKTYQEKLLEALDHTVHDGSCSSNLIDKNTGSNWFVYPWSSFHLWYETKWDTLGDWEYRAKLKGEGSDPK